MVDISHLITPFKIGRPVLQGSGLAGTFDARAVDCPFVFRHRDSFYMTYIGFDGIGYQTGLARSDDLVRWDKLGVMLPRGCHAEWDKVGMACTTLLTDNDLYGEHRLKKYAGKYWLMYHSYPKPGYESGSAEIGLAWTEDETLMHWEFADEPVYSWRGGAEFERGGLYKSTLIEHGGRFYMFYNAKNKDAEGWTEQTGVAWSEDLFHWERNPENPVIPVTKGAWDSQFASDPVVYYDTRIDRWVLFYFGLGDLSACEGLAVSEDLLHWEKFPAPILTTGRPGTVDEIYAHKPSVICHDGCLYHFYCACRPERADDMAKNGGEFRCISVARSKPWPDDIVR